MIESGFLVLVLLGGMIAFAMGRRGAVRSRRRKFEAREAISNDVWLSLNDSTDAAAVLAIVDVFSEDLQVPKDHLYPTDRFDRELRLSGLFL